MSAATSAGADAKDQKQQPTDVRLEDKLMKEIKDMVDQKYILVQRHPKFPLFIYK